MEAGGVNIDDKDAFAEAFNRLEVASTPEEVRRLIDKGCESDEPKPAKYPYKLINGELVKDDGKSTQEA